VHKYVDMRSYYVACIYAVSEPAMIYIPVHSHMC